jgi:hypothetical protein
MGFVATYPARQSSGPGYRCHKGVSPTRDVGDIAHAVAAGQLDGNIVRMFGCESLHDRDRARFIDARDGRNESITVAGHILHIPHAGSTPLGPTSAESLASKEKFKCLKSSRPFENS